MAKSKYFPDLTNGESIADVEQIEAAFELVEKDMENAGEKADQTFSSTSKNAQSGVAIAKELEKYQKTLPFDTKPTKGSTNPVTSDGVNTAINNLGVATAGELKKYQPKLVFDDTPTQGSDNPVKSDGINEALNDLEAYIKKWLDDYYVVKETGKGLSTNDYTDAEKQKNADNAASIATLNLNKADNSALIDYVKFTDYASYSTAGVVKVDPVGTRGIYLDNNNILTLVAASPGDIENRTGKRAIVPETVNLAVKAALSDSKRISNMTDSEKENACETIGAEQETIVSYPTTSSVVLSNKLDIRIPASTLTINLALSAAIPELYECSFSFQSGETATTLTYPGDTIKFVGVDCDESGDFIPTANRNYEVVIKNLATDGATPVLVARVGVY